MIKIVNKVSVKDNKKFFTPDHFDNSVKLKDYKYTDLITKKSDKTKVAFMFLSVGDLKRGDIWYDFLIKNLDKVNLYSHVKNPSQVTQKFLIDYDIDHKVQTNWGGISLIKATNNLLKAAYQDPTNEFFVLVSDSCIPMYDFDVTYNKLIKENKSWVYYYIWDDIENNIRKKSITNMNFDLFYKQSQWMVLKRDHVKFILDNDYTDNFNKSIVPDEHYYINLFKKYYQNFDEENINYPVTVVDWKNKTEPFHPKTHLNVNLDEFKGVNAKELFAVNQISKEENQSLFFRKVDTSTKVEQFDTVKTNDLKIAVLVHSYFNEVLIDKIIPRLLPLNGLVDFHFNFVDGMEGNDHCVEYINSTLENVKINYTDRNVGRDINGQFNNLKSIYSQNKIYDLYLFLHTKKSTYLDAEQSSGWLQDLLSGTINNVYDINRIITIFKEQNDVGMIGTSKHMHLNWLGGNEEKFKTICKKLKIDHKKDFYAIFGTMFWCRSEIFDYYYNKPGLIDKLSKDLSENGWRDGDWHHAYERVFGAQCSQLNYKIKKIN